MAVGVPSWQASLAGQKDFTESHWAFHLQAYYSGISKLLSFSSHENKNLIKCVSNQNMLADTGRYRDLSQPLRLDLTADSWTVSSDNPRRAESGEQCHSVSMA